MYFSDVPIVNLASRQVFAKQGAARGTGLQGPVRHRRRFSGLGDDAGTVSLTNTSVQAVPMSDAVTAFQPFSAIAQKYGPYWILGMQPHIAAQYLAQIAAGLDAGAAQGYPGWIPPANGAAVGIQGLASAPYGTFACMWMPPATWPATWWATFPANSNAILNALGRGYAGDTIQVLSPVSLIPSNLGATSQGTTSGQMTSAVSALDTAIKSGSASNVQNAVNGVAAAIAAGQPQPTASTVVTQPGSPATSAVAPMLSPGISSAPAVAATSIATGMNAMTTTADGSNPYATGAPIPETTPSGYQTTPASVAVSASGSNFMWIALAAVGAFLLFRRA